MHRFPCLDRAGYSRQYLHQTLIVSPDRPWQPPRGYRTADESGAPREQRPAR